MITGMRMGMGMRPLRDVSVTTFRASASGCRVVEDGSPDSCINRIEPPSADLEVTRVQDNRGRMKKKKKKKGRWESKMDGGEEERR